MRTKILRSILSALLLVLTCSYTHAQENIVADTIHFEIGADNRIYVKAYINGDINTAFRFLVDTGASDVVLNASLPSVMSKAEFKSEVKNTGATSSEIIPSTSNNQSLQIGHNKLEGLRFIAIKYPPEAWDGVLGLSFLRNYNVAFNYDRKEMYLYKLGTMPKDLKFPIKFKYISSVPVIPVTVTINGTVHNLIVELDSGSDRVLDITTPYVNANNLRGQLPVFAISSISGTSAKEGNLENVCFDSAQIGNTIFPLLPGAFSSLTKGIQASKEIGGIIGNNLLQRFNQFWDFSKNEVYLSVNNRFYMPFYDFLITK